MRYLGIDYGQKRVGLALSDTEGILGMPFKTIENKDLIKNLRKIVKEEGVEKIILGLPLNMKMEETGQTRTVLSFKADLEKHLRETPVELENEFLTSFQAKKWGAEGEDIDSSSAAIILQSYIDRIKHSNNS
jgi:putative Holliday junction resolvase